MSLRTDWYSVSGGMISSSLILVGPNMLQAARAAAKAPITARRASRFASAAKPVSVTKWPALSNCSMCLAPASGLDSESIKTVTRLADRAQVRPDLEPFGHVVHRIIAERQILGINDLIIGLAREQPMENQGVERVTALVGPEPAVDRQSAERQIADGIEQLVPDEFVLEAQATGVQDALSAAVAADRDGVLERGAKGVAGLAQDLGVAFEAEGAGARDVREVLARRPVENHALAADDSAVEVDLDVEQAPVIGLQRRGGIVVADEHLPQDFDVPPRFRLDLEANLENSLRKGRRGAVENRKLRSGDGQKRVIDAEAREGGNHMLHRRHGDAVAQVDRGAEGRPHDAGKMHGDGADDRTVLELALDLVAAVGRCGLQLV